MNYIFNGFKIFIYMQNIKFKVIFNFIFVEIFYFIGLLFKYY